MRGEYRKVFITFLNMGQSLIQDGTMKQVHLVLKTLSNINIVLVIQNMVKVAEKIRGEKISQKIVDYG